jgi:hypothetical protein
MAREKRKTIQMVVGPFRMAFPALLEPERTDNGERYKVTALFPPDYDISKVEDAMWDVMEDAFGPKSDWPRGRNDMLPEDKLYPAEKNEKYNGFKKGWWALPMSSQEAPGLIDADKNEVMSKREVYGGRWARAQVNITTYDNKSKGVAVYLNHVQLLDHDEAFSGRGNPADAFDKYEMKDRSRDDSSRDRRESRETESRSRRDSEREDRGRESRDRDEGRDRDTRDSRDRLRDDRDDRGRNRDTRSERGRDNDRKPERDERRSRDRDERGRSDDWN